MLFLRVALLSTLCVAQGSQKILDSHAVFRNATLEDADDIAVIVMAAFEPMPDWQYFRQFRHDFPEGHRDCVRFGVSQMLSNPNAHTEVIEAPQDSDIPLIAVAIWLQNQTLPTHAKRVPPC